LLTAAVGPYDSPTLTTSKGTSNDCGINGEGKLKGLCTHNHYEVVTLAPVGFGTNHEIVLTVGGRRNVNQKLFYNFDPPFLESAEPGSVFKGTGFMDALGSVSSSEASKVVSFSGTNFGGIASNTTVFLDDVECLDAQWMPADRDGFPFVRCSPQEMTVGSKNVTLTVASQTVVIKKRTGFIADRSLISTICKSQTNLTDGSVTVYYGRDGEYCAPCPLGGVCDVETKNDPRAMPGFWLGWLNITQQASPDIPPSPDYVLASEGQRCHEKRWDRAKYGANAIVREECPNIIACVPQTACFGNNTCSEGYQWLLAKCEAKIGKTSGQPLKVCTSNLDCDPEPKKECTMRNPEHCSVCERTTPTDLNGTCSCRASTRCALCTAGTHYRLDGKCEKCPDNPAVLIAMLVIAILCAMLGGYVLGQKKFNMAFLSIGVDYVQVLALFAGSDIRWPSWMLRLFQILSIFNFNVDVTAPECLVPDLSFGTKWSTMMSLPLIILAAMLVFWLSKLLYKRICKRKKTWRELNTHSSRFIATFTLLYYYMYLSLTRSALRIIKCEPVTPQDGFLYTDFTDLSCEGGLCRCGEGLQASLVFPAICGLMFYTLGYPVFILIILKICKFIFALRGGECALFFYFVFNGVC
jgi:hypothetical protein